MKLLRQFRILLFILVIASLLGDLEWALANNEPIPLPGDQIPLPGDDIPLPGENDSAPMLDFGQTLSELPFELRGYVENTTTGEYLKEVEKDRLLNTTRVRVDVAGEPNKSLDFGIGVVGTINQGATEADLTVYFPESIRKQLVAGAEQVFVYQMEAEDLFVQEAFATLYTDNVRLRVGRHKFYSGTGYAYNPIDLLNTKNPLDPTYEVDGLDALLLTIDFPHETQLQGLVRYNDRFKDSDYVAQFKTYLNGWDVALQYTHHFKKRIDWEALNTEDALNDLMEEMSFDNFTREFRWHLVGAEFAGEALGFGVYGEGGYVFVEEPDEIGTLANAAKDHERGLIGIDRTFDSQLYMIIEYLRIGQGANSKEDISLNDYMAVFSGEQLAITQDTLFTGLSYPLTDLIEGSLYTIISLNDGSGILNPWLIYDIRPGLKLSASLNIPFGDEDGANGDAGVSGFARLKLNF